MQLNTSLYYGIVWFYYIFSVFNGNFEYSCFYKYHFITAVYMLTEIQIVNINCVIISITASFAFKINHDLKP